MPWYRAPNGQPVYQDDAGLVHLKDASGAVTPVKASEAAKLLSANQYESEFSPATHEDLTQAQAQKAWEAASLGAKAGFAARETVKGIADAATGTVRTAGALAAPVFGAGMSVAKKLSGSNAEVENPLENLPLEALSGEQIAEKIDTLTGGEEAARRNAEEARQFSIAAPGTKMAANAAGYLLGGAALGGLGEVGEALSGAGLFGEGSAAARIASQAAQGATQGYAGASEEAWVRDEKFTGDAALAGMGMGAVLGGGLGAAVEGAGAAKNAIAEKLFGGSAARGTSSEAIEQFAEDATGTKPSASFADKFRDVLDWARDKAETVQSAATGVAKEDLEKYGGLRWTDEAVKGREAYANRVEFREQAATDLSKSLETMHEEGRTIADEVSRGTGKKLENIKPLLTGDEETMMAAAKSKGAQLEEQLAAIDEVSKPRVRTSPTGEVELHRRSIMGEGKQIEDIRSAFEDTIDRVNGAKNPAEAVIALDEFKARMQRAKVNAESSSQRLTSGLEIEQARARAQFANDVSESMRQTLEDKSVWGKFGEAQKQVNSAWKRALDTDKYVKAHLFERVGDDFGRPVYVVDPRKVASYVEGLGTNKSAILDGLLRDNIAARRDFVNAVSENYGLKNVDSSLQAVVKSAEDAHTLLQKADTSIADVNRIEQMMKMGESSRHSAAGAIVGGVLGGAPGAIAGGIADALMRPDRLMMQAVSLREAALKMGKKIDGAVKSLVDGTAPIAKAARAVGSGAREAANVGRVVSIRKVAESQVDQTKRYDKIAKDVVASVADPSGTAKRIGDAVGDPGTAAVRDNVIMGAQRAASFLNSKLPASVYSDNPLTPGQMASVAPAAKAKFLRYYEAVNDPSIVFAELRNGNVAPEHIEALKVCYPALYQRAQMAVVEAVHNNDHKLPYQTQIALADLFDDPGSIVESLKQDFMNTVSQAAQAGGAGEQAKNQGGQGRPGKRVPNPVNASMKGPLDSLRI